MRPPRRHHNDDQVERLAATTLSFFATSNRSKVDMIACLRRSEIMTTRGVKRLVYEVCNDADMAADDAKFESRADAIVIKVRASVHALAEAGDGRARFTLAHELGHAVMHVGLPRARQSGASKVQDPFEREANLFAAAFLMNDAVAEALGDVSAVASQFGVSFEAASNKLKSIEGRRERAASALRVSQKVAAFRAQVIDDPVLAVAYLDEACTCCGEPRLTRNGAKYTCKHCGYTGFQFQDGDRFSSE
jgi:Zn-dependent peptidase ImmA (M78 family)